MNQEKGCQIISLTLKIMKSYKENPDKVLTPLQPVCEESREPISHQRVIFMHIHHSTQTYKANERQITLSALKETRTKIIPEQNSFLNICFRICVQKYEEKDSKAAIFLMLQIGLPAPGTKF